MTSTLQQIANWNISNKGFIYQQTVFGNGTTDDGTHTVLEFISEVSTGFQADIAKKALYAFDKYGRMKLSEKQAWCIEFEMLKLVPQFTDWAVSKYGGLTD